MDIVVMAGGVKKVFEIHQLVDGVTQHSGAGGNGGKSTLQVVC